MSQQFQLNIDGLGSVPVDESFLQLSPQDQEAFVNNLRQRRSAPSGFLDAAAASVVRGGAQVSDALGGLLRNLTPETAATLEDTARRWYASADRTYIRPFDMPESTFQLIRQGRVGQALDTLPRDVAENLGQVLVGIAASAGGPVSAGVFGGASALQGLGAIREEKRDQGLSDEVTGTDIGAAALGGAIQALRGPGGAIRRAGREAVQETAQEGTQVGAVAAQGGEYTPEEVVDRLGQAAVVGGATRGALDATAATARVPGQVATAGVRALADTSRARTVRDFSDEQIVSDMRVLQAYELRREAEVGPTGFRTTNSNIDPSVTFKSVADDYQRALRELVEANYRSGTIDQLQRELIKTEIYSDRRHNRAAAEMAGEDYFATPRDRIRAMGLPPELESAILDGMRDLDTAAYNGMMKNRRGPFSIIGARLGYPVGAAVGFGSSGPAGVAAGLVTGGLGRAIGGSIDRAAGLASPEILARSRVVAREAGRRNLEATAIAPRIEALTEAARNNVPVAIDPETTPKAVRRRIEELISHARANYSARPGPKVNPLEAQAERNLKAVLASNPPRPAAPVQGDPNLTQKAADAALSRVMAANRAQARPMGVLEDSGFQEASQVDPVTGQETFVRRVKNQSAYDEAMLGIGNLKNEIRETASNTNANSVARAKMEAVFLAKSREEKIAVMGNGTGIPELDAAIWLHINSTGKRSGSVV